MLATAELYDPATGTRTRLPSMATPRRIPEGVVLSDGRFAVLGGYNNFGQLASCVVLDLRTLQWAPLPHMLQPRLHFAVFSVGSSVVVAGGRGPGHQPWLDSVEVLELDEPDSRWRAVPGAQMPHALSNPGYALDQRVPPG